MPGRPVGRNPRFSDHWSHSGRQQLPRYQAMDELAVTGETGVDHGRLARPAGIEPATVGLEALQG
jgi:hypothetical protein